MSEHNHKHRWAIILAGRDDARLAPLRRAITGDDRAKHFCQILVHGTFLEQTQRRVALRFNPTQTFTVVTRSHEPFYRGHVHLAFQLVEANASLITLLKIQAETSEVEYGWIEPHISGKQEIEQRFWLVHWIWKKPPTHVARGLMKVRSPSKPFVMVGHLEAFLIFRTRPEKYQTLFSVGDVLGSIKERQPLERLYSLIDSANFSRVVLTQRPGDLSVLMVNDVGGTDLGESRRAVSALRSKQFYRRTALRV